MLTTKPCLQNLRYLTNNNIIKYLKKKPLATNDLQQTVIIPLDIVIMTEFTIILMPSASTRYASILLYTERRLIHRRINAVSLQQRVDMQWLYYSTSNSGWKPSYIVQKIWLCSLTDPPTNRLCLRITIFVFSTPNMVDHFTKQGVYSFFKNFSFLCSAVMNRVLM